MHKPSRASVGSTRPARAATIWHWDVADRLHQQNAELAELRDELAARQAEIDRFVETLDESLAALGAGTLSSKPAQNPYTAAFQARQATGVRAAMRWTWTDSPQTWAKKLYDRSRKLRQG